MILLVMAYKEHHSKCYVVPRFQVVRTGKVLTSQPRCLCAKRPVIKNGTSLEALSKLKSLCQGFVLGSVNFNWLELLAYAHAGHWGLNLPPDTGQRLCRTWSSISTEEDAHNCLV